MKVSAIAIAGVLALASAASAQPGRSSFTPALWKDCSGGDCTAGEAFRYLLWSRASDKNVCQSFFQSALVPSQAILACRALIPAAAGPIDDLGVVNGLMQFVNTQTNTFPLPWGSSGAGFSFVVDSSNGMPLLKARSFGPMFAERPQTNGRGAWNVSFSLQRTVWNSIDGTPLNRIVAEESRFLDSSACQPGNCLSTRWTAEVSLVTTDAVVGASYGLTDRVDVGVTVPVLLVNVSGRAYTAGAFTSNADVGVTTASSVATGNGHSFGVGDISLRGKVALKGSRTGNETASLNDDSHWYVGGSGELRIPSGNPDAMTGTGRAALKGTVLVSHVSNPMALRQLEVHFNGGFVWAGSGISISGVGFLPGTEQQHADYNIKPSNEVNISAGVDTALTERVTIMADYLGRGLLNSAEYSAVPFQLPDVNKRFSQPFLTPKSLVTLHLLTCGAKVHLGDKWVVSGSILFSPADHGLKPGVTPVIGLERQFRRWAE